VSRVYQSAIESYPLSTSSIKISIKSSINASGTSITKSSFKTFRFSRGIHDVIRLGEKSVLVDVYSDLEIFFLRTPHCFTYTSHVTDSL
jgi:hypothetical protein